jgi:hypothetical protein
MGIDVDEELRKYHREDPGLNLPGALRRLYKEHPEIFKPLPSDFEFQQQNAWPAGMIGSTIAESAAR